MSANLLKTGMSWLAAKCVKHMASQIVYRRGLVDVTINAMIGKTDYEITDESGFVVGAHSVDFIVVAADFGEPKPVGGDLVIYGGRKYEVMSLGGAACWEWSNGLPDSDDATVQTSIRIHTRDVGEAS